MIPFWTFCLLEEMGLRLEAAERYHQVEAVAHGRALAHDGKHPVIRRQTERLIRMGFPEVPIDA